MTALNLDRNQLSEIIREILAEDPSIILDALKSAKDDANARKAKIDAIIDEDFSRYEEVFKALA